MPAIVGKSDSYVELPWMAFATGASIAALALVAADAWRPHWTLSYTAVRHVSVVLAPALTATLLAIFVPSFARLFLVGARAGTEVRQYAESMFLQRGLFATRQRTAILILVSLFERRIEIVADEGCRGRITAAEWDGVISRMAPSLRNRQPGEALRAALAAVDTMLQAKGFTPDAGAVDHFPNTTIEERGV